MLMSTASRMKRWVRRASKRRRWSGAGPDLGNAVREDDGADHQQRRSEGRTEGDPE
jgi:hypothetical protein